MFLIYLFILKERNKVSQLHKASGRIICMYVCMCVCMCARACVHMYSEYSTPSKFFYALTLKKLLHTLA